MSLLLHLRRAHFVNGEGEKEGEGEGGTTVFETSHCQDCARQDEDIIICRVGDQALQESGVRTILNDGLMRFVLPRRALHYRQENHPENGAI